MQEQGNLPSPPTTFKKIILSRSQPKHVASMYDDLPQPARKAIEKRDSKK